MKNDECVLEIDRQVLVAEEGFILGNGDFSVSIYQTRDSIIWNFGKNDVWDRRFMSDKDPEPLTVDELRKGIRDERWSVPAYSGKIEALGGTKNPQRVVESLSNPPSYTYPYPNPKPVGRLEMHYPPDLQDLKIKQSLFVEQGRMEINCKWQEGESLNIECYIHPQMNVLCVAWRLDDFQVGVQPFFESIPIWCCLYRTADPSIKEFSESWKNESGCPHFDFNCVPDATPLPAPKLIRHNGDYLIRQEFYPDPTFPDGFEYLLGYQSSFSTAEPCPKGLDSRAGVTLLPCSGMDVESIGDLMEIDQKLRDGVIDYPDVQSYHGWAVVSIGTTSDAEGPLAAIDNSKTLLKDSPEKTIGRWRNDTANAAREFWEKSRFSCGEKAIEKRWYAMLHVARCIHSDTSVPPPAYMHSTINDYSLWHADYHTNYNIQQPFWGFDSANHPELDNAYFNCMDYFAEMGRTLAKDFWNTRGIFVQLLAYPIKSTADTFPTAPMGRMTYMTGWVCDQYWWHYLYTMDTKFLRERGYPFIRDCALFYTDYLEKWDDGKYHAFPSCWGEEGYDGTVEKNTDAYQAIEFARSNLRMAYKVAELLGVDDDLRETWAEILENLAEGKGETEWRPLPAANEPRQRDFNSPTFMPGDGYRHPHKWEFTQRWWAWIDKLTMSVIRDLRGGQFVANRDFKDLVTIIRRWSRPNGLPCVMPVRYYGRAGIRPEGLGVLAVFQEMLIQSWDNVIRLFPGWPDNVDAHFESFRAQGAFLVSADISAGKVGTVTIKSLAGGECRVYNSWGKEVSICDDQDKVIAQSAESILSFETQEQQSYTLTDG